MDRILAMSLVGAGPGNVFGPGMSAGALESFARDDAGRAKAAGSNSNSRGGGAAAARGARSTSAGSGGKCGAERTGKKEANSGASANVTRACTASALDQRFYFVDAAAVVPPY